MPRENKFVKKAEITEYVSDRGAVLEFNRSKGVFYIYSRHDTNVWVWVINPHTKERVRRLRELDKAYWYIALDTALKRLAEAAQSQAVQEK